MLHTSKIHNYSTTRPQVASAQDLIILREISNHEKEPQITYFDIISYLIWHNMQKDELFNILSNVSVLDTIWNKSNKKS